MTRVTMCALLVVISAHGGLIQARDDGRYANSPLKSWFENLNSGRGQCCEEADGLALQDGDWDTKDGHYRVFVEDKWWNVPDDAVVKGPNRDGRTIVWPVYIWSLGGLEELQIRCFMPGTLT